MIISTFYPRNVVQRAHVSGFIDPGSGQCVGLNAGLDTLYLFLDLAIVKDRDVKRLTLHQTGHGHMCYMLTSHTKRPNLICLHSVHYQVFNL